MNKMLGIFGLISLILGGSIVIEDRYLNEPVFLAHEVEDEKIVLDIRKSANVTEAELRSDIIKVGRRIDGKILTDDWWSVQKNMNMLNIYDIRDCNKFTRPRDKRGCHGLIRQRSNIETQMQKMGIPIPVPRGR